MFAHPVMTPRTKPNEADTRSAQGSEPTFAPSEPQVRISLPSMLLGPIPPHLGHIWERSCRFCGKLAYLPRDCHERPWYRQARVIIWPERSA